MRKKLLKFPFPLIIAVAYVFIGVLFHIWHPTWMLFLLIVPYYELAARSDKRRDEMTTAQVLKSIPFSSIIMIVYLVLGFFLHLWHPGWLVFLLIPLYYSLIPMFSGKDNEEK